LASTGNSGGKDSSIKANVVAELLSISMAKLRCSIMWCPWRAKYSFGLKGYYECWFHGGDFYLEVIWGFFTRPIRCFYNWIRYG